MVLRLLTKPRPIIRSTNYQRTYAQIPMREIIKQERNFVADEMVASILITESMSNLEQPSSTEELSLEEKTEEIKQPKQLCSNFLGSLIRCGHSQHAIVARIDNPIQLALDNVKPLLEYKMMMGRKQTLPKILSPRRQDGVAIRWLIEAAKKREYNTVSSLEKGLYDEIAEIFAGTSELYARRFNMHKAS